MKFSVLLPTRNRLEFLKFAIYSVLKQDYKDWEIIVSDNFSEQDIYGYIHSLRDSRIKYFRTSNFISVTDNWNYALEKSTGEYVIMLGDDDCLMKGYFDVICDLIEKYPNPDLIYTSGFLYAYPGVLPHFPKGHIRVFGNADFLEAKRNPFWLKKKEALKLVKHSMNFKFVFAYNMQYALFHRTLIEKLHVKGSFFQSPYPDYYAMNAMMLNAERILACPFPLVTVGISPKSFGFYYFNECESQGMNFLKNHPEPSMANQLKKVILPGTNMNTSWLFSMETIKNNYKDEFHLEVNYKRYRLLQIIKIFRIWITKEQSQRIKIFKCWKLMTTKERMIYAIFVTLSIFVWFFPKSFRKRVPGGIAFLLGLNPRFKFRKIECNYSNLKELFDQVNIAHFCKDI